MICKNCGHENSDNSKFCSVCGAQLDPNNNVIKCSNCGQENDANNNVCINCGTPLPKNIVQSNNIVSSTKQSSTLAIVSLILGIVSLVLGIVCCCVPYLATVLGPVAIVVSIISIRKGGGSKAIAGLVCGIIGFILGLSMLIFSSVIGNNLDEFCQDYPEICEEMCNQNPELCQDLCDEGNQEFCDKNN